MITNTPDNWVIIEIPTENETFYKVLVGWSGGYLGGDSWRMNSGITSYEEKDDYYLFYGYSGSVYKCYKNIEKIRMNNAHILVRITDTGKGKRVDFKDVKDKLVKNKG